MEEGPVDGEEVFMADQQAAEVPQASVGALDDPAAFPTFPQLRRRTGLTESPMGNLGTGQFPG